MTVCEPKPILQLSDKAVEVAVKCCKLEAEHFLLFRNFELSVIREREQKLPRLDSTDNAKITVCFGLDNCGTAHLESCQEARKLD